MEHPATARCPSGLATALVFFASGAVLVLEIVALRLVGPYVGVTLQVTSSVIGIALAAIAYGAWLGGRLADRRDPRALLAPALVLAGIATAVTLPLVRYGGEVLRGGAAPAVLLLAALAVFLPAFLLSAVTPLVVKLQLGDLRRTGQVVGRLSSIGTLGAITATLGTGFILVAALPSSWIILTPGGAAGGGRPRARLVPAPAAARAGAAGQAADPGRAGHVGLVGAGLGAVGADPVRRGDGVPLRPGRRRPDRGRRADADPQLGPALVRRPERPEAPGVRVHAVDRRGGRRRPAARPRRSTRCTWAAAGSPCRATWRPPGRAATSWCSSSTAGWSTWTSGSSACGPGPDLRVRVGDARVGLAGEPTGAVRPGGRRRVRAPGGARGTWPPGRWPPTSRGCCRPDGMYAQNVIDYPPVRFIRAELATVAGGLPARRADRAAGRAGRRDRAPTS